MRVGDLTTLNDYRLLFFVFICSMLITGDMAWFRSSCAILLLRSSAEGRPNVVIFNFINMSLLLGKIFYEMHVIILIGHVNIIFIILRSKHQNINQIF